MQTLLKKEIDEEKKDNDSEIIEDEENEFKWDVNYEKEKVLWYNVRVSSLLWIYSYQDSPQIEKFYNYISNIQLLYALIIHDSGCQIWFACSIDTYCKKARLDILPNGNSNNLICTEYNFFKLNFF